MRSKRPAVHSSGPSSSVPSDPTGTVHVPKVRRVTSSDAASTTPSYPSAVGVRLLGFKNFCFHTIFVVVT